MHAPKLPVTPEEIARFKMDRALVDNALTVHNHLNGKHEVETEEGVIVYRGAPHDGRNRRERRRLLSGRRAR